MWKFVILLIFSIVWALKASENFAKLDKKQKTGCNSTLHTNNSALHLDQHNLTEACYWNITPALPGPITLFFSEVLLHEDDELYIYKNMDDADSHKDPLTKEPIHFQNGSLTIITEEKEIALLLIGSHATFDRIFEGYYIVNACLIPVPPEVKMLYSPTYLENVKEPKECIYRFNQIPHLRVKQVFSFEEFNMSSPVHVEGGTFDGDYKNDPPTDFFINAPVLNLKVTQALNSSDHFRLKVHEVDSACSRTIAPDEHPQLISPEYVLNNGSIIPECRWLVTLSKSNIAGLKFDLLDFKSVFDIAAVNDGLSEFSKPLLQVTTSNRNSTKNQMIRTSGSSMWISFKPISYKSRFVANITQHGQGGYFKNEGSIKIHSPAGDDTIFLLEVDDGKFVQLDTTVSTISPPATLSVYDGFDTNNLLTSISGPVKFPVISQSSKMMITVTKFSASDAFEATFKGVVPDCNHMSTMEADNYVLPESCNSTCKWIIPPQNSKSVLVVNIQFISLQKGDSIQIQKLDANTTELGKIESNETHVPQFSLPANVGALVTVSQAACKEKKDRLVLIGHISYVPGCNEAMSLKASESRQISSPLYPDTYPVFANCLWNISVSDKKDAIVHIAFETFNLANNHCVKISQNAGKPIKYEGKTLPPDDLFLSGDVLVEFDSSGCDKTVVGNALASDLGFLLNVTVADCGAILESKDSGDFSTIISGNQSVCIWKVAVPPPKGDSVNVISYSVSKKDSLQNYELTVYDGSTVRDSEITNSTGPEFWSRTDTLIFIYRRLNVSQPSSVLMIKYGNITCNPSMQCDNKICMHPDWKCNGKNNCGDYSDERDCGSSPIPPTEPTPVISTGYSATAFWLCMIAMLIIGAILGVTVPVCYQKYRDSRYRRFHELDS